MIKTTKRSSFLCNFFEKITWICKKEGIKGGEMKMNDATDRFAKECETTKTQSSCQLKMWASFPRKKIVPLVIKERELQTWPTTDYIHCSITAVKNE